MQVNGRYKMSHYTTLPQKLVYSNYDLCIDTNTITTASCWGDGQTYAPILLNKEPKDDFKTTIVDKIEAPKDN